MCYNKYTIGFYLKQIVGTAEFGVFYRIWKTYGLSKEVTMKKIRIFAFLLALLAVLSLPAFAAEEQTRDVSYENQLAADLKKLGLFSGVSDTNFDLEREPSRTEVLVMLIRVLGKEKEATGGTWEHPFTDVPAWADPYVGYAYTNGLTNGMSATKFGNDTASAGTYLTFMLRALGYSDAKGDFAWDDPYGLAKGIGLLPSFADTENFWRADIVSISYAALSVELKGTSQTLAEKLMAAEVFTAETYGVNYNVGKISQKEDESKAKLTAEQIYANCSSAVFYIEVQNASGGALSSGSGFFIDESGIAVTNWHVIDGAEKAVITLPGSGAKYDVTGVYEYNPISDYALIQVDGSGFDTLQINATMPRGAADVYAIGSPKGLQNTISAGIISNPRRVIDDNSFIQTTAAISNGSSGGVLLNAYGEAIGITSNSYTDGQNLNFARPISCIAAAKTDKATPLGEVNWNFILYTTEITEYTVKVGEVFTMEVDCIYYTEDNTVPNFTVESSDPSVVKCSFGFEEYFIRMVGRTPGTAQITLSDDRTDETFVMQITVVENEEAAEVQVQGVQYFLEVEEIALQKGAEKQYRIQAVSLGDKEPTEHTVKVSSSKYIKASIEFPEDENYGILTVSGNSEGTAEIRITNDLTEEIFTLPVTVGDLYTPTYEKLRDYLLEDGEFYSGNTTDEDHYYVGVSFGETALLMAAYYPEEKSIYLSYYYSDAATLYSDIVLCEDGTVIYGLGMPEYSVYGLTTLTPRGFGDGIGDTIKFDEYSGPTVEQFELESIATTYAVATLYMFDVWLDDLIPGMSVSDFGFVDLNYEAFGMITN